MFCQGVKLADQKHRFKTYTQCFVGSQAAVFCASQNQSREEAVLLGQKIMDEGVFYHDVTHGHHFQGGPLLYRLTDSARAKARSHAAFEGRPRLVRMLSFRPMGNIQHQGCTSASSNLALKLERKVSRGNHHYRSTIYKNFFVGSEEVDVLVQSKPSLDRYEAVILGQSLVDEGVFYSADGDAQFEDDPERFYRFVDDRQGNILRNLSSR